MRFYDFNADMIRYWIRFSDLDGVDKMPVGLRRGCGVTAHDAGDALSMLKQEFFPAGSLPDIAELIVNIDVSTLDPGHILPNIGITVDRGIWFPRIR